jgi:hypothetical protein
MIENTPRTKLPIMLTIKIFTGRAPNNIGDDTAILYLRNAPAIAPIARRTNSIPFTITIKAYRSDFYLIQQ